ncbi:hypothetical protein FBUS_09245 [Fasciolopsis buskii]|uniref:Uncharacterized protein n=1 Tax=Fasciolopsis buskii TaxID=27845 RepID=A0A8E0S1F0_9TREM|nr:hypothetical protein FBUS_09245 [Fasciolopsis buski]
MQSESRVRSSAERERESATPLSNIRTCPEAVQSAKSFPRSNDLSTGTSGFDVHPAITNPHSSLVRTAKYGGRRPGTSPAFTSPTPVVALSRILSTGEQDENRVPTIASGSCTKSVKKDFASGDPCTESKKSLYPKNPFPSCFSSPSVQGFQNRAFESSLAKLPRKPTTHRFPGVPQNPLSAQSSTKSSTRPVS